MRTFFAAALFAALCASAVSAQTPPPTSGPQYCALLNQFVTEVAGVPAEASQEAPVIYQGELFIGSLAVQNQMDPTAKPTPAQITKAAQDSQDCFPVNQQPA